MESSTLLPKIHRNSMLPAMCSTPPCMNIDVKTVTIVAGCFAESPGHTTLDASRAQCLPGCVSSHGIAPNSTTFVLSTESKPVGCCQNRNTITLMAISATVTTGNWSVGMLSLIGNTGLARRAAGGSAASAPLRKRRAQHRSENGVVERQLHEQPMRLAQA